MNVAVASGLGDYHTLYFGIYSNDMLNPALICVLCYSVFFIDINNLSCFSGFSGNVPFLMITGGLAFYQRLISGCPMICYFEQLLCKLCTFHAPLKCEH